MNAIKDNFQKKIFRHKRERSSAQQVDIFDHDELEVAFSRKKEDKTGRSIISKSQKEQREEVVQLKRFRQCGKITAAKPRASTGAIKKVTEEANKTPECISDIQAAESKPMVLSRFDDRLSGKLSSCWT